MVDKEDLFLKIKVNHNGESKEFRSENLPTLDELKSKIMGYLSIPDIKKYMHFSYQNKEGQNKNIEKEVDLFNLSELNQVSNEYYIELYLSIDNELNKIKQFMNSSEFNSNNNNIVDSDNICQKMKEKKIKNKSEMKSIEEIKKLKIEELQNQINEIKERREQKKKVKEMNNKNFENIANMKKELNGLKIRNLINEIQNKAINDIIPLIGNNISDFLNDKNKKFDEIVTIIKNKIKLEQSIQNNQYKIFIEQNKERMSKLNNNFVSINKDLDGIKNEIEQIKNEINNINKNKAKKDSNELQNNNSNNKNNNQQNENINNENFEYFDYNKNDNNKLETVNKAKSDVSSSIKPEQNNESNNIEKKFNELLEEIFCNNLKDLTNDEIKKLKDFYYKLKNLQKKPLLMVERFYNRSSLVNRTKKNKDKLNKINFIISKITNEKFIDNSNEKKVINNKDKIKTKSSNNNIKKLK